MKLTQPLYQSALLFAALAGCGGKGPGVRTYQITVHCQTKDGRPVPLVSMSSDRAAVGAVTNMRGLAALIVDGREGEEVALRIDKLPAEHTELAPGAEHKVVLKNLGKISP